MGAKGDWDFRISDLVNKTLMELIFNPCGEFWWSLEGPFSQIHSPHLHVGAPGIFSDLLRSVVQMLKRKRGAESNGKLPHLFNPSKTANLVPEFGVEDLPLGRTAALVPEFAVKDLPLGRTLWYWWSAWGSFLFCFVIIYQTCSYELLIKSSYCTGSWTGFSGNFFQNFHLVAQHFSFHMYVFYTYTHSWNA